MKKQLKKCWVISFLLVVFLVNSLWANSQNVAEEKQKAKEKGKEIANMVQKQVEDPSKLKSRLMNPMISKTELWTFDNQTNFIPDVSCAASKDFAHVKLDIYPTGDLQITVNYDSNMDGTYDRTLVAGPISILCMNGYISCNLGTLSNCSPKKIVAVGNSLSIRNVDRKELNDCECTNNACGFVVNDVNRKIILKKASNVVLTAFFSMGGKEFAISDTKIEGLNMYFYGQAISGFDCAVQNASGYQSYKSLYNPRSSVGLETAGRVIAEGQAGDPNSYYSLIAQHATTGDSVSKECTYRRVVSGCSVIETNNCQGIGNDCTVSDEIWDGVPVIRAAVKTGLNPLGGCLGVCGGTRCFPWLERKVRYICPNSGPIEDPSTRVRQVERTTRYDRSQGVIYYDDLLKLQGTANAWESYPNRQIWIGEGEAVPECENVCKVKVNLNKKPVYETEAEETQGVKRLSTTTSLSRLSRDSYFYKRCNQNVDGSYSVCPLEPNEELVEDCKCSNEFNKAVLYMQAVRMAGQDVICSSGQKKPVSGVSDWKKMIFNTNVQGFPSSGDVYSDTYPGGG